ncbi:hypothetical protein DVH24_024144 [Malus domestica]|uniref:Uncharacterized protein n=1 Tax=Malus domestica TaxID=3750 RepID=A0A498JFZ7_MALDO|nr:hypothetical protein DVH24_024144 [Malus domestica]
MLLRAELPKAQRGHPPPLRFLGDDAPVKNISSSALAGIERGLLEMGLRPDNFSLVQVLSVCGRLGDIGSGEWIDGCVT